MRRVRATRRAHGADRRSSLDEAATVQAIERANGSDRGGLIGEGVRRRGPIGPRPSRHGVRERRLSTSLALNESHAPQGVP